MKENENRAGTTLVCVTDQMRCSRIIRAGRIIADRTGTALYVINVARSQTQITPERAAALEHLFSVSRENDAVMNVFYAEQPIEVMRSFARDCGARNILTGMPENETSILHTFWRSLPEVTFYVVSTDGRLLEQKSGDLIAQLDV